jgi:hypothetical protein
LKRPPVTGLVHLVSIAVCSKKLNCGVFEETRNDVCGIIGSPDLKAARLWRRELI